MYQKVINHFKTITSIPHCSFQTSDLAKHIIKHAKEFNFTILSDDAGNILCKKGSPKICLQSHYDMVCIGEAPNIDIYEEDGWLKAKNSSLGADNGMGVAIMMALMQTQDNLECLFTNDEEVGLLGAQNLNLNIESKNLLNLDSEEEDEVVIGCAGGVDIFGKISAQKTNLHETFDIYEIVVDGLSGGHSGVDISKNIPSAIKILASTIVENSCKIIKIEGGERNNSIPKRAYALVFASNKIESKDKFVKIRKIKQKKTTYLKYSENIANIINAFSQGVRVYDEDLKMPKTSINLSTIKEIDEQIVLEFFARSMDNESLQNIKSETNSLLRGFGFEVNFKRETSPWKPKKTPFAKHVKAISDKYIENVKICAVHAGLECGVIVKKQPSITGVCSIGPTIMYPHSTREKCLKSSIEKISKIVQEIVQTI